VAVVKKVRTCGECKKTFKNPESFRFHKYRFGTCRNDEALRVVGYSETPTGWVLDKTVGKK
jgi:hypothetical protein